MMFNCAKILQIGTVILKYTHLNEVVSLDIAIEKLSC